MAIFKLTSTNPLFSHIISKNPATITESGKPFRKSIRKGSVFGWFTNDDDKAFTMWFRDAVNQSSFTSGNKSEFEYLDKTRYSSSHVYAQMIDALLRTAFKEKHEFDVEEKDGIQYEAKCSFVMEFKRPRLAEKTVMIFGKGSEIQSLGGSKYFNKVIIRGSTVYEVLNKTLCLSVIQTLFDKEIYIPFDENILKKYSQALNAAEAPYYLRYLFQSTCCASVERFNTVKDILEDNSKYQLNFGNTHVQRQKAIFKVLDQGNTKEANLIDIGCGELSYSIPMSKKYSAVCSIEKDHELVEFGNKKIKNKRIENICILETEVTPEVVSSVLAEAVASLSQSNTMIDVLMTEVMEHNEKETSLSILKELLRLGFRKVVVTVPNRDFNKHYFMEDGELRHPDHIWEPGFQEWCDEMASLAAEFGWTVSTYGVGDVVDGDQPSILSVFEEKVTQ